MIPQSGNLIRANIVVTETPTRTFKANAETGRIVGLVDELEAMRQAVYFILSIERYEYVILDWNYGIELKDLVGKPPTFAMAELKRRVAEALMQDQRITAVDGFEFEVNGKRIQMKFFVTTVFGEVKAERAVEI